jgi:hypothetical protein
MNFAPFAFQQQVTASSPLPSGLVVDLWHHCRVGCNIYFGDCGFDRSVGSHH